MGDRVPVVPGDGRVACQHCPARIRFTGEPELTWMDPDAPTPDLVLWCTPGAGDTRKAIWHKPMPTVRVDQ